MRNLKEQERQKVIDMISYQAGLNKEKIVESTNLSEDLGLDSIDIVELGCDLELEFDCNFANENFEYVKTVNDVLTILSRVIQ